MPASAYPAGPQPDEKTLFVFHDRDGDGRAPLARCVSVGIHFFFSSSVSRPGEPMML